MTETIRELAGLGLGDAKAVTDKVLDGGRVEVLCPSPEAAEELAARLKALGGDAELDWDERPPVSGRDDR